MGYLILAGIALAVAGGVWFKRYHSRDRSVRRRVRRESDEYHRKKP
jgi:hypothetical protein